ncbi:MAG: hypothetical protein E8D49_03210 [Nitrospira sp.]|nr:MAG: hypothetical protein E8D49_03210 [Nitrospira sp.]
MRPLTSHEPINLATLAIDPGLLPPVVPGDPPNVADVTQLVDAFFAQLQWAEPSDPIGSDEVTGAKGRPHLTPAGENPVVESATPRSAVDLSVERDC